MFCNFCDSHTIVTQHSTKNLECFKGGGRVINLFCYFFFISRAFLIIFAHDRKDVHVPNLDNSNMKKQNIYYILALILIFLSCFLYFRTHISKILYPNDYFLSCTDFGQYLIEVDDYSQENKYFRDLLKVGEDPGFFIIASNLLRISNIPLGSIL